MDIYIVRQKGVYWHDVMGVFASESEAVEYAERECKNDCDDYHDLIVTKHTIGDGVLFDKECGRFSQDECESEVVVLKLGNH